jgi:hypothetical protein
MAELITLKGSLHDHVTLNTVKNDIVTYVQSIPNYAALKNDIELYALICKRLKNELKQVASTIDYSQVVLDILTIIFNLSAEEKSSIFKVLQYLEFNKLVKKSSIIKKVKVYGKNFFAKY